MSDQSPPRRGVFARLFRKTGAAAGMPELDLGCPPDCPGHPELSLPTFLGALVAGAAAPTVAKREWSPMFADEVNVGDLIGAPAGMFGRSEHELKVCKIREHEGADGDPLSPYVTLLLVDTTSGEVFSPTISAQQGFRVAPGVPDSLAGLAGGAS